MRIKKYILFICAVVCALYSFAQSTVPSKATTQTLTFEHQQKQEKPRITEHNTFFLVGAEKSDKQSEAFSCDIIPSLQDAKMEWWFNIPQNSTPHVAKIKEIYTNEIFTLFPFVYNATSKNGKFKISYSIKAEYPDNTTTLFVDNAKFEGEKKFDNTILACPDVLEIRFDKKYKTGVYKFTITARDEISGAESSSTASVKLGVWQVPQPLTDTKNIDALIRSFYLTPSPELLYSLFFSPALNLEQADAPNALNYTYIGFFRTAFKRNMFLLEHIRESFEKASPLDRAKIIFLFKILEIRPIEESLLNPREKEYIKMLDNAETPNPYEFWHPVIGLAQIDMLWGEFFASGAYRPVRRIIDLFANPKEGEYAQEMLDKKLRPQTRKDWARFMIGVLHRAAIRTIIVAAQNIPIVEKYCYWAIDNKDLPEASQKIMTQIFGEKEDEQSPFKIYSKEIEKDNAPKIFKIKGN